jgi:hypothetical protein
LTGQFPSFSLLVRIALSDLFKMLLSGDLNSAIRSTGMRPFTDCNLRAQGGVRESDYVRCQGEEITLVESAIAIDIIV